MLAMDRADIQKADLTELHLRAVRESVNGVGVAVFAKMVKLHSKTAAHVAWRHFPRLQVAKANGALFHFRTLASGTTP